MREPHSSVIIMELSSGPGWEHYLCSTWFSEMYFSPPDDLQAFAVSALWPFRVAG